jgi:short subunit dehydrogenase-like uncharacterized protein
MLRAMGREKRNYDVVVFGATGFTGRLAAEYLARSGAGVRLAIAGRDQRKLAATQRSLQDLAPDVPAVGVIRADVNDPESLRVMAQHTRVLITTVGPYREYGEPVVRACVQAGTDYVDLTGEPAFLADIVERYDAPARERGVKIVNACGFDSIPTDLGVLFTLQHLPRDLPIAIEGHVRVKGTFSGGSWQSALGIMAEHRTTTRPPTSHGPSMRRARTARRRVRYNRDLQAWTAPLPTIDPTVVLRSARLLDEYGPDFRYSHHMVFPSLPALVGQAVGVAGVYALAQLRPTRELLRKVRTSGEGPDEEQRKKGWFRITFFARAGDVSAVTEVSGGDPGYGETAKMLGESALCLALERDQLPPHCGVVPPAAALGQPLLLRLRKAGIRFELIERARGVQAA